jgi:hypothetical protein
VEEAVECIFRVDESGEEQESDADIGFREQISKSEPDRIGIEKILQTTYINVACVLKHESQLWLAAIHRRLAEQRSVDNMDIMQNFIATFQLTFLLHCLTP